MSITCAHCDRALYPGLARYSPDGFVCAAQRDCERREDVAWMAEWGESLTGAARRLGIHAEVLARWLRVHAPEANRRLLAREPRDWNVSRRAA